MENTASILSERPAAGAPGEAAPIAGGPGLGRVAGSRGALYSILARAMSPPAGTLCGAISEGLFCLATREALAGLPLSYRSCLDSDLALKLVSEEDAEALN